MHDRSHRRTLASYPERRVEVLAVLRLPRAGIALFMNADRNLIREGIKSREQRRVNSR